MRGTRYTLGCAGAALVLATGCGSNGGSGAGAAPVAQRTPAAAAAAEPTAAATGTASTASADSPAAGNAASLPDRYDPTRDAGADIRAALAIAAADGRYVLIDFGADWCPDCRSLHTLFESPQVAQVLQKNYLLLAVDVGRFDRNIKLASRYIGLETSGIPALVILKPDGSVVTATSDGSFANARDLNATQVAAFLTRWAPKPR
ncbi:thioredoxin family protein [Yinghuangia aomiensis]